MSRPTDYRECYADMIVPFSKTVGHVTNELIQKYLDISHNTLNSWMKKFPKFKEAVLKARENREEKLIGDVKSMLYKRAMGLTSHSEEKAFLGKDGKVVKTTITKHYPPSDIAIIFALVNKLPDEFKHKQEQHIIGDLTIKVKKPDDIDDTDSNNS